MSPLPHAPGEFTATGESLRAQYLTDVLDVLYPEATATNRPAIASGLRIPGTRTPVVDGEDLVAEYIVVPDRRRARLLVPAGDRRVAAAAVARYAEVTSRSNQLKRQAVIAAFRTGAARLLLRDRICVTVPRQHGGDSIDAYLTRVLGRPFAISIHVGPARANRKPVLQLLAPDGETVGFVKLGVGTLTRSLVRTETNALSHLGRIGLTNVSVPRILHAGQWRGHEVLVQSALPIWEARATLSTKRLSVAMREVATCLGVQSGQLAADPYWKTLRSRLDVLTSRNRPAALRPDGSNPLDEARALIDAADQLVARVGYLELRYGSWHGDWTPWNMATTGSSLLIWDWERFTAGVPLGFDAVHFDFQRLLNRGVEPDRAIDITLGRTDRLLAPFEVDPEAAKLTGLLYLIDLATRYLEDRQAEAGAALGVLGRWLLPVLTRKVAEL